MSRRSWSIRGAALTRVTLAASVLLGGVTLAGPSAPVQACSSMAPLLTEVALTAQVIVRAEIGAVRSPRVDPHYDLRVLEVLKGRAPRVIRGFEGSGQVRGGVCDEGWYGGEVGDPVFLFLGTTQEDGTLYHPRLQGRSWSQMNDGIATRSSTAAGIAAEIRALVPGRRALIPEALVLGDLVDAGRPDPPAGIRDAVAQARLLHHTDGRLSIQTWRAGGRRVERFVIRAGDLATPGPVLFTFPARNTEYQAWAVGRPRDAFQPSPAARTVRQAMQLVDSGRAVMEVWVRRSDRPRLHGVLRPVPMPVVSFSPGRQVRVGISLPALARRAVTVGATVPVVGSSIDALVEATSARS